MSFPVIRNPLLPSPPPSKKKPSKLRRSEFFSNLQLSAAASLKPSLSTDSFRQFVNQTIHHISGNPRMNKRIMPSGMPKSATMATYTTTRPSAVLEPLVHYNGPQHTLEDLPVEKLHWIKEDLLNNGMKNPLAHYSQSIVLRKPMKLLQVIATDSSKVRSFRCTVQVNDETCTGSFVTSEKSGKNGSIVQFDETFLFDIEQDTQATLSVFAKNRSLFGAKQQEVCLGKETIDIGLCYKPKSAERFVLNDDPHLGQSNDYQMLVVHGTFVSRRSQILLNNTVLFEDYITAHIHSGQSQVIQKKKKGLV
ncbi:hypothetical protein BY458DRAFT_441879 [Sporodiniella umbellata]|nr:hypothetical protein BY458DRAFT_441879 [Sporodiniella umbellata]